MPDNILVEIEIVEQQIIVSVLDPEAIEVNIVEQPFDVAVATIATIVVPSEPSVGGTALSNIFELDGKVVIQFDTEV